MAEVKLNEAIKLPVNRKPVVRQNKNTGKKNNFRPRVKTEEEIKEQVVKALEAVGGKYVKFDDIDHTEGLLVAGVVNKSEGDTPNDTYCFVVVNGNRQIVFVNNNEHFSVIRDVPASLYILDYLYHREAATLLNKVQAELDDDDITLLTKIYVHVPTHKPNKGNKKTKNTNKKS